MVKILQQIKSANLNLSGVDW